MFELYKYDISIDDWDDSLSYVVNKVFKYNTDHIIINNVFTANVIIDLCHKRDNYYQCPLHLYSHVELKDFLNLYSHYDCHCIIDFLFVVVVEFM